jgi:hypothetical protein
MALYLCRACKKKREDNMKLIEVNSLPLILQTLKEKKYFYDDSELQLVKTDVTELTESNNNNVEILGHVINDSGLDIVEVRDDKTNIITGYKFNLYSTLDSDNPETKTIIASNVLSYDTVTDADKKEVITNVRNDL